MEIYEVTLDNKQYTMLKKMLVDDRKAELMRKQPINGFDLFCDMLHEIYSPAADGWSTLETVIRESSEELGLLRFMTAQIFPDDEDYFVRQLGKSVAEFQCKKDFSFKIYKTKVENSK